MNERFSSGPDRVKALARYRLLAGRYDSTCDRILLAREAAVRALDLKPGETVFDVACGTGAALPLSVKACGPDGHVVGIEQSPEMSSQARARLPLLACSAELVTASVEDLPELPIAHAMLFCYTQDVLQSPRALRRLAALAGPGCRVAIVGARFLPWSWGFALNALTAARGWRYLTTFRGMRQPWAELGRYCPGLRPVRHFHLGTSYLAVGRFHSD